MNPAIDGRLALRIREIAETITEDTVSSGGPLERITLTATEKQRVLNIAADVFEEYIMQAQVGMLKA